eukprot:TRINITY_DN3742_c0_g1_i2.p1 TRINITY_DN3742_c0_g1~~TRINITY_DN3742_c0_g1_i2.p1  ORF type:complete len:262 (-),score=40.35 TRINITY_DN3742_c0_g1_i2:576-1304(-)
MASLTHAAALSSVQQRFPFGSHLHPSRNLVGKTRLRVRPGRIEWDPEELLGPPSGGHIARRQLQRELDKRGDLERQLRKEKDERRQARSVPDTVQGLVDYLLETDARDMEFEIARCRPRLNQEFLEHLKKEIGTLRFAVNRTQEIDDRLIELEALYKILVEGIEAYDKMTSDLTQAKDRLANILSSKDKKATLLDMAARNELDRTLLALLDENIAVAQSAKQDQAVAYMEKIRTSMLKYLTI